MNASMSDLDFDVLFGQTTDSYYIANHKFEFEAVEYITSYDMIITNGTYNKEIDQKTGYLTIKNLRDADYIIYLDTEGKIVLSIYKHIPENLIKNVQDGIKLLWKHIDEHQILEDIKETVESKIKDNKTPEENTSGAITLEDGLVDLNELHCTICGSTEFNDLVLCDDNRTIEAQCKHCYTIFRMIPSRYYVLHSYSVFPDTMKNRIIKDLIHNDS